MNYELNALNNVWNYTMDEVERLSKEITEHKEKELHSYNEHGYCDTCIMLCEERIALSKILHKMTDGVNSTLLTKKQELKTDIRHWQQQIWETEQIIKADQASYAETANQDWLGHIEDSQAEIEEMQENIKQSQAELAKIDN